METVQSTAFNNRTEDDDSSEFLKDPSLFRDELPQPFRMINKVLNMILDDAWAIIAQRCAQALKKASRKQASKYDCATLIPDVGSVSYLVSSPDDKYLFVATGVGGLLCIDACSQQVVACYVPDTAASVSVTVTHMSVMSVTSAVNMVITIDTSGTVKLFVHLKEVIYWAYSFYDTDEVSHDTTTLTMSAVVSLAADYIGFVLQTTAGTLGTNVVPCYCVEIYRLPKDAWLKELDPVIQLLCQECPPTVSSSEKNVQEDSVKKAFPPVKFSQPSIALKIQPPVAPTGNTWNSPYQAFKMADAGLPNGAVGTGTFNVISKQHLELRMAAFEEEHQQHVELIRSKLVDEMFGKPKTSLPTINFLLPATVGCQSSASGQSTSMVAVCWTDALHVYQYQLNRAIKDIEAGRADIIWPTASTVVTSSASSCGCLFAVALSNNNIIVYDRTTGLVRRHAYFDDAGAIANMFFNHESSSQSQHRLVIKSSTGRLFVLTCCVRDKSPPAVVYSDIECCDEMPWVVSPVKGQCDLLCIVRQDGRLFVHDINKQELLCELVLPVGDVSEDHKPLMPVAFGTLLCGRMLYVIADIRDEPTYDCNIHPSTPDGATRQQQQQQQLLVYKLMYLATLDCYFHDRDETTSAMTSMRQGKMTLEDRVNRFLQSRMCIESERLQRLNRRWCELKEQFQPKDSLLQSPG